MWSLFILWVFLCVCSQIGLVTVFMGLFLGFIFCFSRFGDWVWLLDLDLGLLEIGLVASWIWKEHEENFLLVFNLIFSSCFHLCSSK